MAEVEVYEVFCFCAFMLDVFVIVLFLAYLGKSSRDWTTIPCVTKLPKFLPTIQCHVAPALESNYRAIMNR